ncbi:MAG: shikimate kinase [Methanomassiliicoccales archaeon]
MRGEATCHGAATIVNAIATGRGAAFGLDLFTRAVVEITDEPGVSCDAQGEDPSMVCSCVEGVIERFAPGRGARVSTESNIPVSRGLKSSSAAANAAIMASLDALSVEMDPVEAVRMGTRKAVEAGVSVTGAFDDAAASMLGGVVVTDNREERIIKRDQLPEGVEVLLHVPEFRIRKGGLPLDRIRSLSSLVEAAFGMCLQGDYLRAMTLNGLCYSVAQGLNMDLVMDALKCGALAAGLSGTGPATAILVPDERAGIIMNELERYPLTRVDLYRGEGT